MKKTPVQKAIQPSGVSGYSDHVNAALSKMHAKEDATADEGSEQPSQEPDHDADDAPSGGPQAGAGKPSAVPMPSRFSGIATPHQGHLGALQSGTAHPAPKTTAPRSGFPAHGAHESKYPKKGGQ